MVTKAGCGLSDGTFGGQVRVFWRPSGAAGERLRPTQLAVAGDIRSKRFHRYTLCPVLESIAVSWHLTPNLQVPGNTIDDHLLGDKPIALNG